MEVGGALFAHATHCPHRLGPLEDAPVDGGELRCPWHGYRFNASSGASSDGRRWQLEMARVEVDVAGDAVWLHLDTPRARD